MWSVLLSDRDLVTEIKAGTLALEPFEPALVQPSSIDVRLDRLFRVFNNHLYTHIDPAVRQDELTSLVEVPEGEPFVLHPGEFVLASTLEVISLGDTARRAAGGQVEPRPAGAADPLDGGLHRPGLLRPRDARTVQRGQPADHALAGHEDRPAVHLPALVAGGAPVRLGGLRVALPGPARADTEPRLAELAHLADDTDFLETADLRTSVERTTAHAYCLRYRFTHVRRAHDRLLPRAPGSALAGLTLPGPRTHNPAAQGGETHTWCTRRRPGPQRLPATRTKPIRTGTASPRRA